jgi:D-alanine-D-alanine ligase
VLRSGSADLSAGERERLGLPVSVRPASGGAVDGTGEIRDWADLPAAVTFARAGHSKVLVEAAPRGRRIACAVLAGEAGGAPAASVCGELRAYQRDELFELTVSADADVPPGLAGLAVRAYTAVECAGPALVHFQVSESTGEFWLTDLNAAPGLAPNGLFARLWEGSGVDFPALVGRLVRGALRPR